MAKKVARLLEQGIAAAKVEQKIEAEQLLRQVIELDPENERAWLWLSAVVTGVESQRECLYRVLEINPHNSFARHGLAFLSRLREGQEWRAAEAPWVEGLESELAAQADALPQPCPRCGTPNPAWARTCGRCGVVLQPVDIVESVRAEERVRSRSSVATTVIESWAGVLTLKRKQVFEPEAELASVGRSLMALFLGSLLLTLVRAALTLVPAVLSGRALLPLLRRIALPGLWDIGTLLGGMLVAYLLLALLTFLPARLLGGKGSLGAHFHLVAVTISSWLVVVAVGVLVVWVPVLLADSSLREVLHPILQAIVGGLLLLYAIILLAQALQTAHQLHIIWVVVEMGVLVIGVGLLYRAMVPSLPQLQELLLRLWSVLLFPVSL